MTFITYKKIRNKEYAYETTSYWNKELKQPRNKFKYIGVVIDKKKKIFGNPLKEKLMKEQLILDFGDTYFIQKVLEKEGLIRLLQDSFGEKANAVFSLLAYKLCHPSAMRLAETWQSGNTIKLLNKADIQSQRISDLLVEIGEEDTCRMFFENYLSFMKHSSDGLILDITAMPNQIHIPFSQWGYSDECIDKQIKLMLVVDKSSKLPLFFRYIPGSIADVSSLKPTMEEIKKFGIENTYCIFDAGFYSEPNIKSLQGKEIPFMVRLPASRTLYKEIIAKGSDIESIKYAVKYGERGLFIKKQKINLFGKGAYVYTVLDPERKGRETRNLILGIGENEENDQEFALKKKGIMILVSSINTDGHDALSLYYSRNIAEQLFKFSKDDLKLLPLRTHKEESMRGYLLLVFISLSAFLLLRKGLGKQFTVEEALLLLRNLKAKVFRDEMLIPEITKKQKLLFEKFDIIVPKVLGI